MSRMNVALGLLALACSGTTQAKPAAPAKPAAKPPATDAWASSARIVRQGRAYTDDVSQLRAGGFSYGKWSKWLSADDMPADLKTHAFHSDTFLSVETDPAGKVTGCRVLKPSDDARLDAIACARLRENAQFEPSYAAPGKPIAKKINISASWETVARSEWDEREKRMHAFPPVAPPPAPGTSAEYLGWPRQKWVPGLQIDRFPDLQAAYPANPGKPASGTTTLELTVEPETANTTCTIGQSSGNPMLDEAACTAARALPLSYPYTCEDCGRTAIPLQFVWAKKGSHIRVPLPDQREIDSAARYGGSPPRSIARDPADTRKLTAHDGTRGAPALSISPKDFADIADRQAASPFLYVSITIDAAGKPVACETKKSSGNPAVDARMCALIVKRARYGIITDVFGDPMGNIQNLPVGLKGAL